MSTVPRDAQRPYLSMWQTIWASAFVSLGVVLAVSGVAAGFWLCLGLGIIGALPHPNGEGALFFVTARALRFHWNKLRRGTVYRRHISSADLVLQRGVSPMKGLFKLQLVLLEFLPDAKNGTQETQSTLQVPALLKGHRHTVFVDCGTNPSSALADDHQRDRYEYNEASVYADIARELGVDNSFTVWSLHRRPDTARDRLYLDERMQSSLRNPQTPEALEELTEHFQSFEEIIEDDWDRSYGLSMTASNPKSWKGSRLNKLTQGQLLDSSAISAALVAEEKLAAAGISSVSVSSYPMFCRTLRELIHVHDQELPRDRAMQDKVLASVAAFNGKKIDVRDTFTRDDSPLPEMQREVANNYLIFDGSYHRVLWITDYLNDENFDALHSAPCNYFVGIYCDIKEARRADSQQQDKARLLRQLYGLKRNTTAQDEEELETLDSQRYDALRFGEYIVWFRTLIIVSGRDLSDLEENHKTLSSHLARRNIRVKIRTVTGPDQLEWFFAAIGAYGSS